MKWRKQMKEADYGSKRILNNIFYSFERNDWQES